MPSVGSVTSNLTPVTKTAAYTAAASDLVLANATSAAFSITLPVATLTGTVVAVRKTDSSTNAVTVLPNSGQTVNGTTSYVLFGQGAYVSFQYDLANTNWIVRDLDVMPAGGNTSQVLTKNSGTSYDASWVTAAGGVADQMLAPLYTSGSWYSRRSGTPALTSYWGTATSAATTSTIYYYPQFMYALTTINAVSWFTGSTAATAGSVVRVGAYNASTTTGLPTTLVADMGTFSPSTSSFANTTLSLGSNVALPKAWIWWALSFNSVSSGTSIGSTSAPPSPVQGIPNAGFSYGNMVNGTTQPLFVYTYATGTGNATASALANNPTVTLQNSGAVIQPDVYFRVA